MASKSFILDTNVFIHEPSVFMCLGKNVIYIPLAVVEELDKLKKHADEVGAKARESLRLLDELRARGRLTEGVPLENGGRVVITSSMHLIEAHQLPRDFVQDVARKLDGVHAANDEWLRTSLIVQKTVAPLEPVILVTKDLGRRIKADSLNIGVEDFRRQTVTEEVASGVRRVVVSDATWSSLTPPYDALQSYFADAPLTPNECVLVFRAEPTDTEGVVGKHFALTRRADLMLINRLQTKTSKVTATSDDLPPLSASVMSSSDDYRRDAKDRSVFDESGGYKLELLPPRGDKIWNVYPRSDLQHVVAQLFLDRRIEIVTVLGQAGSGKTLLALAAALHLVFVENAFDSIIVTRPIVSIGKDMGALPGDIKDKLYPWSMPIFDNLKVLLPDRRTSPPLTQLGTMSATGKKGKKKRDQQKAHVAALRSSNAYHALAFDDDDEAALDDLEDDDELTPPPPASSSTAAANAIYTQLGYATSTTKKSGGGSGSGGGRRRATTVPSTPALRASKETKAAATADAAAATTADEADEEEKQDDSVASAKARTKHIVSSLTFDKAMTKIELEAFAYIRGRSLARRFIIVDEAQNITPSELRTIVSRAAKGTKIVLLGDPSQIDSSYLDAKTNGLVFAASRLVQVPIHAGIKLELSERSALAAMAAKFL